MAKKKYYVVWEGYETGVFDSWEEAEDQIKGYPGARYKSYDSLEAAIDAYRGRPEDHIGVLKAIASHSDRPSTDYATLPGINLNAIAVDAACSGNPGPMEYRGIDLTTGQEIFHVGPLPGGTNNVGEFLAIVHALALLQQQGRTDTAIYSDSKTGMAWVRRRTPNTNLTLNASNTKVMQLLSRATNWLLTHTPVNPIIKWPTETWGEIPADFNRK